MVESLEDWERVPELVQVHGMLKRWYRALRFAERGSDNGLRSFTDCTRDVRREGKDTVELVAIGIQKLQNRTGYSTEFLDKWLDGFLLSRIGSNMLLDQYYACARKLDGGLERPTGIINRQCDAVAVCKQAADYALRVSRVQAGKEPIIHLENYAAGAKGPQNDSPCHFSFVPAHLRYIMVEILKNSCHATVQHTQDGRALEEHPIHVLVCSDRCQVGIRVSDRAGGIPFDVSDKIWSYLWGTAERDGRQQSFAQYGVGLPHAKLHARYLGGKLELTSYPGYGTDVSVMLPRLDVDQVEAVNVDAVFNPP